LILTGNVFREERPMSDLEQRDGSDFHAQTGPPTGVTAEAVINSPEQQATLGSKTEPVKYPLSNIDLVDAQAKPTDQGPKYEPPYYNLRYDYSVDQLEEGIGKMSLSFDSITNKMSELLKKPEIRNDHKFSVQSLKDTLMHPELSKRFSADEIQTLRLMANQARRVVDPATYRPNQPMDKVFISKQSVQNTAKLLGVIKEV
jgi:hypothetical protein